MNKDLIKILFGSLALILFIAMIIIFFKYFVIAKAKIFFIIFFSIMGMLLIAWFIFYVDNKLRNPVDNVVKDMKYYFDKINFGLGRMPDPDVMSWKKGRNLRFDTKSYDGVKYVAFIATSKLFNRMLVIFNTKDNSIDKYQGDPGWRVENDLFHKFEPKYVDKTELYARTWASINKSKGRNQKIIVNSGGSDLPDLEEDL